MTESRQHRLWYVRRKGDVRGPFPTAVISQFLLLGRLKKNDEVSLDRHEWSQVDSVPELSPEVLKADFTDAVARSNLEAARIGADERDVGNRRQADDPRYTDQRRGEQRGPETPEMIAHRQRRAALQRREGEARKRRQAVILISVLVTACVTVALILIMAPPRQQLIAIDCDAPPAVGVNWSNCNLQGVDFSGAVLDQAHLRNANLSSALFYRASLEGADLAYANLGLANLRMSRLTGATVTGANLRGADLRGADLRGVDLSYADLREARLAGAVLDGVRLDKAVWIDGTPCAPGSLGGCVPGAP